jgi:hypothetical protein
VERERDALTSSVVRMREDLAEASRSSRSEASCFTRSRRTASSSAVQSQLLLVLEGVWGVRVFVMSRVVLSPLTEGWAVLSVRSCCQRYAVDFVFSRYDGSGSSRNGVDIVMVMVVVGIRFVLNGVSTRTGRKYLARTRGRQRKIDFLNSGLI